MAQTLICLLNTNRLGVWPILRTIQILTYARAFPGCDAGCSQQAPSLRAVMERASSRSNCLRAPRSPLEALVLNGIHTFLSHTITSVSNRSRSCLVPESHTNSVSWSRISLVIRRSKGNMPQGTWLRYALAVIRPRLIPRQRFDWPKYEGLQPLSRFACR